MKNQIPRETLKLQHEAAARETRHIPRQWRPVLKLPLLSPHVWVLDMALCPQHRSSGLPGFPFLRRAGKGCPRSGGSRGGLESQAPNGAQAASMALLGHASSHVHAHIGSVGTSRG